MDDALVDQHGWLTAAGSTNILISAGAVSRLVPISTSGCASDLSAGTVADGAPAREGQA